jgi:hypothetical protein
VASVPTEEIPVTEAEMKVEDGSNVQESLPVDEPLEEQKPSE